MVGPFSVRRTKRFARALERDNELDSPGSGRDDSSPDPKTRQLVTIVEGLRAADFDEAPSAEFKARLRERLLSVAAAQLAQESPATPEPEPSRHRARPPRTHRTPRPSNPRLALLAGAMSVLVAVSGLTLVASNRALPGDTLYALKRTTENVELAFARGDESKAHRYLDFAQTRARELKDLVAQRRSVPTAAPKAPPSPARLDADDVALVRSTLDDMDRDTRNGVRLMTTFAVNKMAEAPLADLATWESEQRAILAPLVGRLPGDTARRAGDSTTLLGRIHNRVQALRDQLRCSCMDRAHGDDLGPLPCWPCDPSPAPQAQASGSPPRPQTTLGTETVPQPTPSGTAPPAPPAPSAPPTAGVPTSAPTQEQSGPILPSLSPTPSDSSGGELLPPILPDDPLSPLLPGLPDLLPGLFGG